MELEAEEREIAKEKRTLLSSLSAALIGAIILSVICALLSIFSVVEIGSAGIPSLIVFVLIGAGFGFCLGFIYGIFPSNLKVLAVLIIAVLLFLVFSQLYKVQPGVLQPIFSSLKGKGSGILNVVGKIKDYKYCFTADPRCPFFISWEEPYVEKGEEDVEIDVRFSERRIKEDNTINVLAEITVVNKKIPELHVKPKCYFKKEKERELKVEKLGSYAKGNEFVFPMSDLEMHTTLRCSGSIPEAEDKNVYTEYIVLELERPVSVTTTWPVWIGKKPNKGIVRSIMSSEAPYSVALASNNDMPFEQKKEYDFKVIIKRKDANARLKEIEELVITYPLEMLVECNSFESTEAGLALRNVPYQTLKEISDYEKEKDKFIFPCSLYVTRAPVGAIQAPIVLNARYVVYSDYITKVYKAP